MILLGVAATTNVIFSQILNDVIDFGKFNLVNAYVPNSGDGLKRLGYRTQEWEPAMRKYLSELMAEKPLLYCGDLNVAHKEIDLKNPSSNRPQVYPSQTPYRNSVGKILCELGPSYEMQNTT